MKTRYLFWFPFLLFVRADSLARAVAFQSRWPESITRPWPGPEYWSNPLQDWRIADGRLECIAGGGNRNVYLLTREIGPELGDLEMSVRLGSLDAGEDTLSEGWVGFRVGIRGLMGDYRDSAVRGDGLNAGMDMDGRLFIGRPPSNSSPKVESPFRGLILHLVAEPAGDFYRVALSLEHENGDEAAKVVREDIDPAWLTGGVALVCSAGPVRETPDYPEKMTARGWGAAADEQRGGNVRFRFSDWSVSGSKVVEHDDRAFGPVLFTLYTLSSNVLKLTAQMAPVGDSCREVSLEIQDPEFGDWRPVATSEIDPLSRVATFRIPGWDDSVNIPYRVLCSLDDEGEPGHDFAYEGVIRKDPRAKETITVAAFTGNNDLGFPHADIVAAVRYHEPDLLVFTGDQIYEAVGGYGIQRAPLETATLDYLRKWYIYGWEYRDLTRDRPTVCLPDDHDVYHGNIWGAGGKPTSPCGREGQDLGGYCMPAEWVKVVHRTQTNHLPDPYDPTPVEQGIPVYYCHLRYGGVSFAVIEDRKWKSAPRVLLPEADIVNGWAQNPDYDAAVDGDVPGAVLLGERQLKFLEDWAADWSDGTWMKAVLSQTLFADVATLPADADSDAVVRSLVIPEPGEYPPDDRAVQDHDSDGWPQTGRNRALRAMRKGFTIHIAGDQHLGSTVQYGVDAWNDAGFALCVPSVSNIFPRRWFPPEPGLNHQEGDPRYTGEFKDGFGNRITVHAVSNPEARGIEPTAINDRAPGYGIVRLHRTNRTIEFANWPRWVDPSKPGAKPYPGWPVTFDQIDNYGGGGEFHLPAVRVRGMDKPVIQVVDEGTGDVVYTIRSPGSEFHPRVLQPGTYTLRVGEPGEGRVETFEDLVAASEEPEQELTVEFR
jgi:phosphodiesterase/alkaline phosphatase D-like protein